MPTLPLSQNAVSLKLSPTRLPLISPCSFFDLGEIILSRPGELVAPVIGESQADIELALDYIYALAELPLLALGPRVGRHLRGKRDRQKQPASKVNPRPGHG
jgi:hypothetical protein